MKGCIKISHIIIGIVAVLLVAWIGYLEVRVENLSNKCWKLEDSVRFNNSSYERLIDYASSIEKDSFSTSMRIRDLEEFLGLKYGKSYKYDTEAMNRQLDEQLNMLFGQGRK